MKMLIAAGTAVLLSLLIVIAVAQFASGPSGSNTASELADSNPGSDPEVVDAETDVELDPELAFAAGSQLPAADDGNAGSVEFRPPKIGRWVEVGRQKRVIPDVMRLHIPAVWYADPSTGANTLIVEVEIENIAESKPLTFLGWSGGDSRGNQAMLWGDNPESVVYPLHSSGSATAVRPLTPGQTFVQRLEFPIAEVNAEETLQLVLPYSSVGLTGNAGFIIPRALILDGPPASEPLSVSPPEAPSPAVAADGKPDAAPKPASDPWSIGELRRQIREGTETDGSHESRPSEQEPRKIGSDTPLAPDTVDDLKKSIDSTR
jgi:hypothetical protein